MQMKKVVCMIMVVMMLLSVIVIPASVSAAENDIADTAATPAENYGLAPNVQSGNILHAFNWRMRDLVKYAPEIAKAGYSSVQISPIQATKAASNAGTFATDWWSFYQPTDMTIGNALGTAAELQAATTELHKYGIKVVADVVTNHVQNCKSRKEADLVAPTLSSTSTGARHSLTQHPMTASDSTRQNQVQGDLDGQLPDMNTSLKSYQNYVINNLLNPLADNGVDGYRFDAAKHIETPDDGSYASDYWPTVTSAIKAKNSNAYIYGEILANAGKFQISSYTKYINVTDYAFGDTVRGALNSKNASNLTNYGYSGSSKNQNVLWLESHDTFCAGTSTGLTKAQQIVGWAVVGSRADAPALFFVRPNCESLDSAGFIKYDEYMGAPGSSDTWKNPVVVAVNKFKNAFVGQNETTTASGSNLFVQRGTTGMVIANLNASSTSINQSCSMTNGTYTDQVTGNTFTVSGGKISGNVGSSGVAVIYNTDTSNTAPEISVSLNNTSIDSPEVLSRYTASTATVKVNLKNATSGTIKVNNLDAVSVNGGDTTFTLNSTIPYGKSVSITVTATNGVKTVSRTYSIKKKDPNETKKVYFDNSAPQWATPYLVAKTSEAAGTCVSGYGFGEKLMTNVSGNIYTADVPSSVNYVKFSIGPATEHLGHTVSQCGGFCGPTLPQTVIPYGTANLSSNRERGGYMLEGAMIMRDLRFEDYGEYPAATLSAGDTSLSGSPAPTDPPATDPPATDPPATDAPVTEPPTEPGVKIRRGDVDFDDEVAILDATRIQRHLADMNILSELAQKAGDVNSSGDLDTTDVTSIQRWLCDMGNPCHIDEFFYVDSDQPVPTNPAPTNPPSTNPPSTTPVEQTDPVIQTDPVQQTDPPVEETDPPTPVELVQLPNRFVAMVYCEAFGTSDADKTKQLDLDSYGTLTYDFPDDSYVFVRNYDTGVQYATDGWTDFAHPVTLVNEKDITGIFDKMYVPAGTHTLVLQPGTGDTYTLDYDIEGAPVVVDPTTPVDPTSPPSTQPSDDGISFLLTDNFGWGAAYVYAWDANGTALNGEWPGASQAETIVNDYGQTQFRCYVPEGAVGVILSNGNGAQTEDITDFGTYDGYWMDGSQNNLGHYKVTGWNY